MAARAVLTLAMLGYALRAEVALATHVEIAQATPVHHRPLRHELHTRVALP